MLTPKLACLKAEKITATYEDKVILKDLDFTLFEQDFAVIIGPNGCGKSTLLKALARILKIDKGKIFFYHHNIYKLPPKELAKQIAFLGASPRVFEPITIYELVARGRYPYQNFFSSWSEQDEVATQKAIAAVKLEKLQYRLVNSLSGGQKQRAFLAMLLAQESSIILLDEPTNFLDIHHQIELLKLCQTLHKQGKTFLFILHDINLALRFAKRLIVMKEGKIYAQGSTEEIFTPTLMKRVFSLECHLEYNPRTKTPFLLY